MNFIKALIALLGAAVFGFAEVRKEGGRGGGLNVLVHAF